jgi:aryl-alcohol dehydrogenase-like predicted oxidoreductase
MTPVGLGCVGLGSAANRSVGDDVRLVRAAVDLGITVFDTADAYGNGASERVLGKALRGRRDAIVVATKGGFVFRARPPLVQWARRRGKSILQRTRSLGSAQAASRALGGAVPYSSQDFSPRHLRDAVHASLRRLRTDRIDVYQLHGPPQHIPGLVEQLADLVLVGDVVRFGIGADSVPTADAWIEEPGIDVLQVPFGVLGPEAAATTFPRARAAGRDVWVRGVLGAGLLGLADRDPAALAGDPNAARLERLRQIADDAGLDVYQLAFGFVRAHADDIAAVLVGSTSVEHLARNVELLTGPPLPVDVRRAVDAVAHAGSTEP